MSSVTRFLSFRGSFLGSPALSMKVAILVNKILNDQEGPACGEVFGRLNGSLDLRLGRRIALAFKLQQCRTRRAHRGSKATLGPEG